MAAYISRSLLMCVYVCVCVCVCVCVYVALFGIRCQSCFNVNFNIVFKTILMRIRW